MTQDEINRHLFMQMGMLMLMVKDLYDRDKPLGNNTTTRGKDCKVIPLNINARIIAQELRDE